MARRDLTGTRDSEPAASFYIYVYRERMRGKEMKGCKRCACCWRRMGRGCGVGEGEMVPVTVEKGEVFFWPEEGGVREMYCSVPEKVDGR
jgi:hypothetical protein